MCLDMQHQPLKFDDDTSMETQIIVQKPPIEAYPRTFPTSNTAYHKCMNTAVLLDKDY